MVLLDRSVHGLNGSGPAVLEKKPACPLAVQSERQGAFYRSWSALPFAFHGLFSGPTASRARATMALIGNSWVFLDRLNKI